MSQNMLYLATFIGGAVCGAGITVLAYLAVISRAGRHHARTAGRHQRPDHGADIAYADELRDLVAADISADEAVTAEWTRAEADTTNARLREAAWSQAQPEVEGETPLHMLAADIREAAGYGRPVPPPITTPFTPRPYVTTVIGGGQ